MALVLIDSSGRLEKVPSWLGRELECVRWSEDEGDGQGDGQGDGV